MYGVVSLLDTLHSQQVENLWKTLKIRFGVANPNATSYPHFSYHVANGYEMGKVSRLLEQVAGETAVFTIHTAGLGIFTGAEPVVYIPVARSPGLTKLHEALWPQIQPFGQGSVAYYTPPGWLPHITLGHGDIAPAQLGSIVQWLNEQNLTWEVTIHNFAILHRTGTGMEQVALFPFG